MSGDRTSRRGNSSPRRARAPLTIMFLVCAVGMPACLPEAGLPLYEMPAWAALALGGVEALVVLAGLVAACWLLMRDG